MPPVGTARPFVAAGALFLDDRERVLLVEPTYKREHDIPGGMVEPGETPREACVREIREELSLDVRLGPLLAVDSQVYPTGEDIVLFVFDGGHLSHAQRDAIVVDGVEIRRFRFVAEDRLSDFLPASFVARLRAAAEARRRGEVYDLRAGQRVEAR
ncbi:NUDIX domain-containing protein [Micromonospora globbae]|uniref:NUDIX domain-containing protein n=1 Tax=Micromonospora globbae TaxID=1894969 RepID=UPI003867BEDC|nr:NUDIX hydrolase [Micromonospora globbae]